MNLKTWESDRNDLLSWYRDNKRPLPWRNNRDPYRIWISEVMLQQTTVAAVIPYFEKFMKRFPTVHSLAGVQLTEVYEMWAGLGYYSRARNLHKAAIFIVNHNKGKFPKTATELIQLPGFGPYTSRAVASLAFNEKVGVLDGNVIRILCRRFGLSVNWWQTKERQHLQNIADQLAQTTDNADVNQAMMELGATVCTPKKPLCLLCPWKSQCVAHGKDLIAKLPKSKPKEKKQIWHWEMQVNLDNNKIYLEQTNAVPFLKNQWFPIGTAAQLDQKPKSYDLTHSITKYAIYVTAKHQKANKKNLKGQWIDLEKVRQLNPTSLMTKILNLSDKKAKLRK